MDKSAGANIFFQQVPVTLPVLIHIPAVFLQCYHFDIALFKEFLEILMARA